MKKELKAMKLIEEKLYWIDLKAKYVTRTIGIIADSIEDALSMAKTKCNFDESISEIRTCSTHIYRPSTKTITVEV